MSTWDQKLQWLPHPLLRPEMKHLRDSQFFKFFGCQNYSLSYADFSVDFFNSFWHTDILNGFDMRLKTKAGRRIAPFPAIACTIKSASGLKFQSLHFLSSKNVNTCPCCFDQIIIPFISGRFWHLFQHCTERLPEVHRAWSLPSFLIIQTNFWRHVWDCKISEIFKTTTYKASEIFG